MAPGCFIRLAVTILLAGAAFVSCSPQNRSRLIIVGAGVSGIGAATRLLEKGFQDFRILEAEGRIGGRVHTVRKDGRAVDYGAHWVHGGKGNPVYDLVQPLGVLEPAIWHEHFVSLFSDGSRAELVDPMRPDISPYEVDNDSIRNVSVKDILYTRSKPILGKNLTSEQTDALMKVVEQMLCTYDGCDDLGDVSAHLTYDYHNFLNDTNDYIWKNDGYGGLIDVLLRRHPKSTGPPLDLGDRLRLNSEVTKITVKSDGSGVEVLTKSGEVHLADLALVTVSAGVLKERMDSLFQPPLPEEKKQAIKATGFGTIGKIILRFPNAWWPTDSYGYQIIWLEKDKATYKGEYPWETEVSIFAYADEEPNGLTAWTVGEAARQVERTPVEGVTRACMRIFRRFLGLNVTIPEPLETITSTWGTNPHFRGSYSYRSLAAERHNVSHLATPLVDRNGKEVVFFSGEATHPTFFGTVGGALDSGWREAERILKKISETAS